MSLKKEKEKNREIKKKKEKQGDKETRKSRKKTTQITGVRSAVHVFP